MPQVNPVHLQYALGSGITAGHFVVAAAGSGGVPTVQQATSPLQTAVGIALSAPSSGSLPVAVHGDVPAVYGETLAAGVPVTSNASGQAVSAKPGHTTHAITIEAGASGQLHPVTLLRHSVPAQLQWSTRLQDVVNGGNWGVVPGGSGHLLAIYAHIGQAGTGAGASLTLQPRISGVLTGGGLVTITTAAATLGAVVAGTAISGANSFGPQDVIDLAGAVATPFSAGVATLTLVLGG